MKLSERLEVKDITKLKDFDRYVGSRRTEIKVLTKKTNYRGFDIYRNNYIPVGAHGYYEVPELHYTTIGRVKKGFLTVSITQAKENIDRHFELNEQLNNI